MLFLLEEQSIKVRKLHTAKIWLKKNSKILIHACPEGNVALGSKKGFMLHAQLVSISYKGQIWKKQYLHNYSYTIINWSELITLNSK